MLAFQGMQVQEVFGDYQFHKYDVKKTPRLILIAKKRISKPGDKRKRDYTVMGERRILT